MITRLGLHAHMKHKAVWLPGRKRITHVSCRLLWLKVILMRMRVQTMALLHWMMEIMEVFLHSKWELDFGERLDVFHGVHLLDLWMVIGPLSNMTLPSSGTCAWLPRWPRCHMMLRKQSGILLLTCKMEPSSESLQVISLGLTVQLKNSAFMKEMSLALQDHQK